MLNQVTFKGAFPGPSGSRPTKKVRLKTNKPQEEQHDRQEVIQEGAKGTIEVNTASNAAHGVDNGLPADDGAVELGGSNREKEKKGCQGATIKPIDRDTAEVRASYGGELHASGAGGAGLEDVAMGCQRSPGKTMVDGIIADSMELGEVEVRA